MRVIDWLEDRTGLRTLVHDILYEPIPGGARWRYVWGSTLVFLFALQVLTGVLLMAVYSPSSTTAWGSVWYIQTQMPYGWLVRGLHHFGSQAMIILLPLHVLQVLLAKAYRAPRECNWWIGLGLLGVTLALSLSGYLLPWDQKGYWATRVATNLLALTPIIGESLQKVLVGGSEYGNATLTRFFTLHVMILPTLFVLLVVGHVALFRRHGLTGAPHQSWTDEAPTTTDLRSKIGAGLFWPDQIFRDTVACAAVLAGLLITIWYTHSVVGAHLLDAPADPTSSNYPARPEWYFLFLFQLLKYFEGPAMQIVGAVVLPGVVIGALAALPLLDRLLPPRWAHRVAVGFTCMVLLGAGFLTYAAVRDDRDPPDDLLAAVQAKRLRGDPLTEGDHAVMRARRFNRQRARAGLAADRALLLAAQHGIPPEGPLALLANDPVTRGPVLFAANCAACHRFNGHDGLGNVPPDPARSSDLGGFATRQWIRGLLENPMGDRYFGLMVKPGGDPAHTRMSKFIDKTLGRQADDQARSALLANFDAVAAYLEDESTHPGRAARILAEAAEADAQATTASKRTSDDDLILRGRRFFMTVCNECHSYDGERSGTFRAPEMSGYGSVEWIELMIADPSHETRYRSRGKEPAQMPAFTNRLSKRDRRLIALWLHTTREVQPGS
jgi:ubiquinol-cytochrome c reductase cytochrome b subunit